MVEDGYEFFAKRQLVTLFSAPNYCGEFDNAGAMMSVDETLMCSFQVSVANGNYPKSLRSRLFCRSSSQHQIEENFSLIVGVVKVVVLRHHLEEQMARRARNNLLLFAPTPPLTSNY